jgi:hypothetical protein
MMHFSHALRPDLAECYLEDRTLLALPIGLMPSGFLPNGTNNTFVVPGFQAPGTATAASAPGPSYFYLLIGSSGNTGVVGSRIGGGVSVFGLSQTTANGVVPVTSVGSGANAGASGGGGGGSGSGGAGYGGSVSSGYNTSLNQTNNFGMATASASAVPAGQSYDSGPVPRGNVAQDTTDRPTAMPSESGIQTMAPPDNGLTKSPLTQGIDLGSNNLIRNSLTGSHLLQSRTP